MKTEKTDYVPFAEALKRGKKIFPKQNFGQWYYTNGADKACVLGTACVGAFGVGPIPDPTPYDGDGPLTYDDELVDFLLEEAYSWLWAERASCPVKGCCDNYEADTLYYLALHLNDTHKWSRERIGKFLAPFEERWLRDQKKKKKASKE